VQPAGRPSSASATSGQMTARSVRDALATLIAAVLLAVLIRTFVVEAFVVSGVSMIPTFANGEHVLVDKFAYTFSPPQDGQIIVFRPPLPNAHEDFIKRVIGTPGQTVRIVRGRLYVDGKPVAQPYIEYWDPTSFHASDPVRVPPGDVFVLGDNRPVSEDSRIFGMVPIKNITGQAVLAFWPLSRAGRVGQPQPGARGYKR